MASEDNGHETTLPELQGRCVLLVARDIASHVEAPLQRDGLLHESCCGIIRGIMHRVWAPAVRMVSQYYPECETRGCDWKGKQLLDLCRAVLGNSVRIAESMPQAKTFVNIQQLRAELKLLTRLSYQHKEFDCKI